MFQTEQEAIQQKEVLKDLKKQNKIIAEFQRHIKSYDKIFLEDKKQSQHASVKMTELDNEILQLEKLLNAKKNEFVAVKLQNEQLEES